MDNVDQEIVDPGSCGEVDTPVDAVGALTSANGLIRLSRLIQAIFAAVSARHDLTPVQARLLGVLSSGPKGMAELARTFGVERAAMTGLIDRAERAGLVQRVNVPGDRRAVHVSVTELGSRTGRAVHADSTDELDRLLAPLSAPEQDAFHVAMTKILMAAKHQNL